MGERLPTQRKTKQIEIDASQYFDKKGKQGIEDPATLKAYILNIYKTMMLRGIRGTYVYVCDEGLREYMKEFIKESVIEIS
jgi:DUF2075 family protein